MYVDVGSGGCRGGKESHATIKSGLNGAEMGTDGFDACR